MQIRFFWGLYMAGLTLLISVIQTRPCFFLRLIVCNISGLVTNRFKSQLEDGNTFKGNLGVEFVLWITRSTESTCSSLFCMIKVCSGESARGEGLLFSECDSVIRGGNFFFLLHIQTCPNIYTEKVFAYSESGLTSALNCSQIRVAGAEASKVSSHTVHTKTQLDELLAFIIRYFLLVVLVL